MKDTKVKKAKTKAPEGVKVSKEFEFTITDSEKSAIADKGAALYANIENTKINFKELKNEWSAKIKTLEAQHAETQHAITAGVEKRVVECILEKDYDTKEIRFHFEGKVLESRTMTIDEMQMEINEVSKSVRGKKQKIDSTANLSGMTAKTEEDDIKDVVKAETSKRTKRSAVDGPVAN